MFRILAPVVLVACLMGCGGGTGDGFSGTRGPVTGKITCGGQPVPEGCKVVFQSKEGANYMSVGSTNAKGEYTLLYNAQSQIPGVAYIVTVTPPVKQETKGAMSPDQMANAGQAAATTTAAPLPFPERYTSAVGSKLEFTVKAGKTPLISICRPPDTIPGRCLSTHS
ncbi:MAG: hypothetical protein JWM11_4201 [Planctomycetaceae bacterium]|nr:hypothetical protein [Planctomycetaceae bacterium]